MRLLLLVQAPKRPKQCWVSQQTYTPDIHLQHTHCLTGAATDSYTRPMYLHHCQAYRCKPVCMSGSFQHIFDSLRKQASASKSCNTVSCINIQPGDPTGGASACPDSFIASLVLSCPLVFCLMQAKFLIFCFISGN